MAPIDELYRLVGDEDCGVGLTCRVCDRGGLPVAYLRSYPEDTTYAGTDVVAVDLISALLDEAATHRRSHHAE